MKIKSYIKEFREKHEIDDLSLFIAGIISFLFSMLAFISGIAFEVYYILKFSGMQGVTIVVLLALLGFIIPFSIIPFFFSLLVFLINFYIIVLFVIVTKWIFSLFSKSKDKKY